jgi:hypothetical protein
MRIIGLSDVQVSVGFGRKSGSNFFAVFAMFDVFLNDLLDEVQRLSIITVLYHRNYLAGTPLSAPDFPSNLPIFPVVGAIFCR